MNYHEFLDGSSVVDINANYAYSIANIRRQLQADAEKQFNIELIKNECPNGNTIMAMHEKQIYVHDLSKLILCPYCYSYSLLPLVLNGLKYNKNFKSNPAKRLSSFNVHIREFFAHVAVRTRGACGFPDIFACMAFYVKKHNLLEESDEIFSEGQTKREYLSNLIQSLFYSVNQNLREGSESMFTNISFFDKYYCEELFTSYCNSLGIEIEDIMNLQRFVMEWHTNEITNVKMLRWPVITIALIKDHDGNIKDQDFLKFVCEQNQKHSMYNFLVLENAAAIASCCRLVSDIDHPFLNSYGSGSVSIGSHQVVSLNLPRMWIECGKSIDDYKRLLHHVIDETMQFLEWHRSFLAEYAHLDEMYEIKIRNLNKMFSTIGIIGFDDLQAMSGISDDELESIVQWISECVNERKQFANIELVPAENAAIKLFEIDKQAYPDESFYKDHKMYCNQIANNWVDMSLGERCKRTARFAKYFSGGSMTFVCLEQAFANSDQMATIVSSIAKNNVPYFCFDTNVYQCENGHNFIKASKCPSCGADIKNTFRRTVGFFVPIEHMHKRTEYDVPYRC